jgi:putative ABC transport system permease protein
VTGFALRMAWRETRAAWRQFAAFLVCVTLGVAALSAVGTLAANLDETLGREAKALLGGDVEARSTRAFDAGFEAALAPLGAAGATVTRTRELVGMAREPAGGRTLLVELKAVDGDYPLYGRLEVSPPAPLAALVADDGAVVGEPLLARLGLRVGDRFQLGAVELTVRGVVAREPDRPATVVSLGPRVFLSAAALDRSGLVRLGSRVRHRVLLRLPEASPPPRARDLLAAATDDPAARVVTYDEAQPGLRRFFVQLTTYLGLVGLVSLLVGGIGVASAIATFLRRRLATIAILKCVGAESRTLLATYLLQTQVLGLLGSAAGAVLGVAVQPLVVALLAGVVPFELSARPEPATILRAVAMGVLTTLLASLWPLLRVRAVRPSLLLRATVDARAGRGRRPWPVALPIAAGLAALCVWQAGSLKVGAIFVGAALAALVALAALARGLALAARLSARARGLAWRHGVANLHRPGGQTAVVVVSLGVGVMLLVAVALLERGLAQQIDHEQRREAPSFFFIDVQPDQRDGFASLVADAAGAAPTLTPVVRARLAAIDGAAVSRAMVERRRARQDDRTWYLTRDYVLTAAAAPPDGNVVLRGRWWTEAEAAATPRVSVEEDAAKALGVDVGSRLAFDVQGVTIEASVDSVRRVDWQSLSTNFFVIFSQGALDGAPTTYVATARVPPAAETRLQDQVVRAFPNVTAIPVRDVLERVSGVLDQLALAIRVIALFSIASGLVVMVGALTASRYQRLYESVILRTMGATRATVARAFAVEYGCLGAAAGLGGSLLATVLAWIVLRFVLAVPWTFEPATVALGVVTTTALAVAIGFLATFRLLGAKPLPVLRRE